MKKFINKLLGNKLSDKREQSAINAMTNTLHETETSVVTQAVEQYLKRELKEKDFTKITKKDFVQSAEGVNYRLHYGKACLGYVSIGFKHDPKSGRLLTVNFKPKKRRVKN